ncbi:POK18 protein, partial [Podargus strigoides]|nr:POK18 protein [Podargus strigoides]
VELSAGTQVFKKWHNPINIITGSAYVAVVVLRLEASFLKEIDHKPLFDLFETLLACLNYQKHPYYVVRIRCHTNLSGPLVEGNRRADMLAGVQILPNVFEQALLSHAFYHQNAKALQKTFCLSISQAHQIITACPDCQLTTPSLSFGVNP